ncbi:MAG: DUF6456 domain-containing protein [Devosia sp.]
MADADARTVRFARALLSGGVGRRQGSVFSVDGVSAPARFVSGLIGAGALDGDALTCRANDVTRNWLRREMLEPGDFAGQHRATARRGEHVVSLVESPLARLAAAPVKGKPFLEVRHLEAGDRIRRLVEKARLQPRTTMTYSASRTAGSQQNHIADLSDLAADARKSLAELHAILPRDCAGVVLDVCGFLKGLQQVETERGWPRRSAKLVLRIGLDKLADHYGIGNHAIGKANGKPRNWMAEDARPHLFE